MHLLQMVVLFQLAEHEGLVLVTWRSGALTDRMLEFIGVRWLRHRTSLPKQCSLCTVNDMIRLVLWVYLTVHLFMCIILLMSSFVETLVRVGHCGRSEGFYGLWKVQKLGIIMVALVGNQT